MLIVSFEAESFPDRFYSLFDVGDLAVEVFTCLIIFKNIFSFALTFKGYSWLTHRGGIKGTFVIVGSVQTAVCVCGLFVCESCPRLNML